MIQPGVQDSNAARSAVASSYIKECSGLWVVAPITRAADDKVAQHLVGDSFKRQLQFDGIYSRITFICSKTDNISVTEALKAVAENHPAHKLHAETGVLEEERDKLQETISQLKKRMTELDDEIDQCLTEITELKSAIAGPDDEDEILVSPGRSLKRATRGAAVEARKR
jgi:predicted  nucleic acid-binding Zn-ribbon protein